MALNRTCTALGGFVLGIPALQHWSDPILLQDFAGFGSPPATTRPCPGQKSFPMASLSPSPFWFGKIHPDFVPVMSPRHDLKATLHQWHPIGVLPPRHHEPPSHHESAVDLDDFWKYPGHADLSVSIAMLVDVQVFMRLLLLMVQICWLMCWC